MNSTTAFAAPAKRSGIRLERSFLILVALFLISLPLVTPRVAASDEIEYFSYLPSLLIDHDLQFRNQYEYFCGLDREDCIRSRFQETFLDLKTPTGLQINFAPMGTAVLWLPFYLAGHLVALLLQNVDPAFEANGVSLPYIYAVCIGSLFYGWAGIYLAFRIARAYVAPTLACGAALVTLFATNAVYYVYVAPAFSHAASLFASALFVFVWWRTREARARGDWVRWLALGASGGLMTMVREQEAVLFVIPVVEAAGLIYSSGRSGGGGAGLRTRALGLALMAASALVVFAPQFLVYRVLNGNWLPAHNVTDKFTWDGAHIGDILFSNFHGLFTWTPVLLFAVAGLALLWRRDKLLAGTFLAAFAAETYLLGSFSTWFGGAAFGMRRYINCTVLFVVGLAFFAQWVETRTSRRVLAAAGILFVIWNIFFIVQFVTGMVPRQQPVDMLAMAYNQFVGVPPRLLDIAGRFIANRGSFYNR